MNIQQFKTKQIAYRLLKSNYNKDHFLNTNSLSFNTFFYFIDNNIELKFKTYNTYYTSYGDIPSYDIEPFEYVFTMDIYKKYNNYILPGPFTCFDKPLLKYVKYYLNNNYIINCIFTLPNDIDDPILLLNIVMFERLIKKYNINIDKEKFNQLTSIKDYMNSYTKWIYLKIF